MQLSDDYLKKALANPEPILTELSRLDCEESFAQFVKEAWHTVESKPLTWNWHLDTICGYLEAFYNHKIRRLIINEPPGMAKSLIVSVLYPAWAWAKDPSYRFLGVANGEGLATRDSQRHKWIIESEWFQARWPMEWKKDMQGKGLFGNSHGGFRQAVGITSKVTGKRGDDMLIDDPHDAKTNDGVLSDADRMMVIDAYDQKLSNRLNDMNTGGIVLIMQRLHAEDLTGHLMKMKAANWVHLVIPMEYEGEPTFDAGADIGRPELNDPRTKEGELLLPQLFGRKAVEEQKEAKGQYGYPGQYQQRPTAKGGGIIKKHMWRLWPEDKPLPLCIHVFSSYDTAFSEPDRKKNAYSARTDWGVFQDEVTGKFAMFMLGAWHGQVGFPELRKEAKKHHRKIKADRALIEKKASGQSLIQELRRASMSVYSFDPKHMDKTARAHLAAPMWDAGLVYYPKKEWAKNVIEWVSQFPNGSPPSADYMDTVSQAGLYVRKRMFMELPDDEWLENDDLGRITDESLEDAQQAPTGAYG